MDVYLDHNATAPARPEVIEAMADALAQCGNPSSVHRFGRLARRRLADAREALAARIGADPANVVFTAGGTEANNLALRGVALPALVSAVEHDSVLAARDDTVRLPVDADGRVDTAELERQLAAQASRALVSIMLANNETGVIQPVAELAAVARRHGAVVHCDAAQAVGKIPLSFSELGVDLMTVSAHKFGGPQGVGALIVADHVELAPILRGGGQERRRRAGTENVAGIHGCGVAAALAGDALDDAPRLAGLRDGLEARIRATEPAAVIYGADAPRLPNTSCIGLPGVSNEIQVMALDLAGIAVSAGSACSSGKLTPSHVLLAVGADAEAAASAIRVSLGWQTTEADIDRFFEAWTALARRRDGPASAERSVA